MPDIYNPSVFDKVFYVGEDPRYLYRLFTVTSVDRTQGTDNAHPPIITLTYERDGIVIEWKMTRPDLLTFCYSGAPKYAIYTLVWMMFGDDQVQGQINNRFLSLSEIPNTYLVQFVNSGMPQIVNEKDIFLFDSSKLSDSTLTTMDHINQVRNTLQAFAISLLQRGEVHDASKLQAPEKQFLDARRYLTETEGDEPYGSEGYRRQGAVLKPMLKHHQAFNDHHPEFHANGVYSMNLMQIVEMWADWQAAAKRGGEVQNLGYAAERYCMEPQLKRIFANTNRTLGIPFKD